MADIREVVRRRPYKQLIEEEAAKVDAVWMNINHSPDAAVYYGGGISHLPIPAIYSYNRNKNVPERRRIATRPLTNISAYFAAMHEIGHFATNSYIRTPTTPHHTIISQEVRAWNWALEHSAYDIPKKVLREAAEALESYLWYGRGKPLDDLDPRILQYL